MKNLFTLFLFIIASTSLFAQTPGIEVYNPPIPYYGNTDWGNDYLVSSTEPFGRPSGVYRTTNNTIYVSVPDTNILAGKCIVILSSTNNGANWTIVSSVSPAAIVTKTKMIRSGTDSIYCFFLFGTTVYSWNIISNNFNSFTNYTTIRDFDVTGSSTSSLYLIIDLYTNNDTRLFGSATGGTSWGYTNFLSSTAVFPRIYMSGSGDTAIINYYGVSIAADTISSAIRSVRYRESAPGSLSIVGSFSTPIAAGTPKDQMMAVFNLGTVWLFYTSGLTGNIDLNCMVSVNSGLNYGTPFFIGSLPLRDEYWFDAKHYTSGVDLVYYSDSLQSGLPTSSSDKLFNSYTLYSSPESFSTPAPFTQKPPSWSSRLYIPTLIEYYNPISDAGVIWVGFDGAVKKLYYDRYASVTGIIRNENLVADNYYLSQNYPNPFNPTTKIDFSISKNGPVSLKIYDITGREVSTLINKEMNTGNYTVDMDASNLTSGIYFYKLTSANYSQTKKMILVK